MADGTKIFNRLFLIIIVTLIVMSLLSIVTIHWSLFDSKKYSFSFSPNGINNYLTAFSPYKELLTATVATIAVYFGLLRLKAATDANNDKIKQDRFLEWKTVLEIRCIEIERFDPYMKREFIGVRYNLFKQLYDLDFFISNKIQLSQIFQKNFQNLVSFFEKQNHRCSGMGEIYPDKTYSYSFDNFRFLLLGTLENYYPELETDLETLYLAALPAHRLINAAAFQVAQTNYHPPVNNK